jgi:hypothetical protein
VFPKVAEFAPLIAAADGSAVRSYDRGSFTVVEGNGSLRVTKPAELPEAIWWGAGTGGMKGTIAHYDERELVIG